MKDAVIFLVIENIHIDNFSDTDPNKTLPHYSSPKR
jgi:hypothetical protein